MSNLLTVYENVLQQMCNNKTNQRGKRLVVNSVYEFNAVEKNLSTNLMRMYRNKILSDLGFVPLKREKGKTHLVCR